MVHYFMRMSRKLSATISKRQPPYSVTLLPSCIIDINNKLNSYSDDRSKRQPVTLYTTSKIPKAILTLAFSCLAMALLSSYAFASDKQITMFVPDTDWPPYIMSNSGSLKQGVLVEILTEVAHPLGYSITTVCLPNKRGWLDLHAGNVDVHAKAMEWVQAPDEYDWTEPFMLNEDVLLFKHTNTSSYSDPQSLYGMRIAAIEGFVYPALEEHFGKGKIIRVNVRSPYNMLELIDLGRVDAALVNKSETQWLFRQRPELNPDRFRIDTTPVDSAGYRYAFTKAKDWKPFIKEFNKAIVRMRTDGSLDNILNKYK